MLGKRDYSTKVFSNIVIRGWTCKTVCKPMISSQSFAQLVPLDCELHKNFSGFSPST